MARTITLPARTLRQEIVSLEEYPPTTDAGPGSVSVVIGAVDDEGQWVDAVPRRAIQIEGDNYRELVAVTPPSWAPDKPAGTYRNEDVWHFIDLLTAGE